jgi:hypothetical protein
MKIYKQETNISCGVACLRSIFAYYDLKLSEKEILDKNEFYKTNDGVLNPIISSGITTIKFGFKAKYIGYNPMVFNNIKGNLKKSLNEKLKIYKEYGLFLVQRTIKFIELGGEIQIEKLNIENLKKLIDENEFFIANVRPAFYNENSSFNNIHKIIVTGYNEKGFIILCPTKARKEVIDFQSFLMAFYAGMPEILIIKKH